MMIRAGVMLMCITLAATAAAQEGAASGTEPERGKQETAVETEKAQDRETQKPPKPLAESPAVDLSKLDTLARVIERAAGATIVYLGEYHDRPSNHAVQLEVIKALYARDSRLAVGMEMFQRPFQAALDDYIAGSIDERTFLKRSEYFTRWSFDYHLYKPILDFCRERKIPVVALNVRREITRAVSAGGLDSLSEQDRREIPAQMDLEDAEYRARLKKVFEEHRSAEDRNFEFFLQAQVLWDETMAESIDRYLRDHPGYRMVVLAGNGHLAHGSGIPKRVARRAARPSVIILNDADVTPGIADYIVYPEESEGQQSGRLMVLLSDEGGRVVISGFSRGSVAQQAGFRKNDVILAIDGTEVSSIDDVRIELLYKKKGDTVSVRVRRERFLLGDKTMTIEVKL